MVVLIPCLAVLLLGPGVTGELAAHPLHTALTEISYDEATSEATIRVRIFADDLESSLPVAAGIPRDTLLSRYGRGTFALVNRAGRPSLLKWEGLERVGDLVVLRLGTRVNGGLTHARVLSAVLWERFPDQVNIVRISVGGRVNTLLFTRGDGSKPVS
jgi:hypothetical protein